MIENSRKHREKSKLCSKFQQPAAGPADSMDIKLGRMSKTQKQTKGSRRRKK